MKKQILALVLGASLIPGAALAQGEGPLVYLRGRDVRGITSKNPVIIREDRTFLPVRLVGEELGFTVDWNQEKQQVHMNKDSRSLVMTIGQGKYVLEGKEEEMDVAPFLQEDRTYVPLRFVAEALDAPLLWDGENAIVMVGEYAQESEAAEELYSLEELSISFRFGKEEKEQLTLEENTDFPGYSFYDRKNREANDLGFVGSFAIEKEPQYIPVPHINLGAVEGGYLCFNFASDVNYDLQNPQLTESYGKSRKLVEEILRTVELNAQVEGEQ
ncbi:MAG: copper amine oxidase N-terminal domain-containing protein [Tissierellia bacterium]|nr:copper amine oxidase N-terminal domain-containing protein [Tissierellia bacterium]